MPKKSKKIYYIEQEYNLFTCAWLDSNVRITNWDVTLLKKYLSRDTVKTNNFYNNKYVLLTLGLNHIRTQKKLVEHEGKKNLSELLESAQ